MRIRRAKPDEGERLRAIAESSKAYWGYDRHRIREWAAMGDFSPPGLRAKEFYVAEIGSRPVAFASLIPKDEVCVLDDLWVEPKWIRKGIGSSLFRLAAARAKELGARRLEWEAEPNAIGFYEKLGGRYLRDGEPSVWGRRNPIMGLEVTRS